MSEEQEPPPVPEGARVPHALRSGHQILEYVVERTLGGGGFGITYLARDANLNLTVAVKEYLPADMATRAADGSVQPIGGSTEEQFRWGLERFLDEARALATFRHPNIVRVLRYFPANGTAYIVMEYESGESLKQWRPRHAPVDHGRLMVLIRPLLDGLEMIHKAGFLHRDIKPDNIYVRADGTPVLIDFGAARRTTGQRDMTSIVSPGFAPFEQYHSQGNQGPWTDLYSLAAVMYWLVSGQKPLESASRLRQDAMLPATRVARHDLIGESVLLAIDWALNPDEGRRPQSVAEFRNRLLATGGPDHSGAPGDPSLRLGALADSASRSGSPTGLTVSNPGDGQRRNMVCTVLFLDIVAYSKVSVNEQYDLKSLFNQMIAGKLAHVPDNTRITLDTGDGAAICFMGDPEEVLHASVDIQRTLALQQRLNVRMGLHIGPIRILNDLNGRSNVIGDGINVAQRIMSFADDNSLVASRAFYEVVACLSDGGEQAFRYLGERRDKHDRGHEIYAIVTDAEAGLADRTIPLASPAPVADDGILPAVIDAMEKELARHLGPLAPILVRRCRARARTAEALRDLLAQSISDPAQRAAFMRVAADGEKSSDNSASRRANAISGPTTASRNNSAPSGPSSQSGASLRPWLMPETIAALEKHLAQTVGPMARVLVKNEARKAESLVALREALSLHIDNPDARTRFLKDSAGLGKH